MSRTQKEILAKFEEAYVRDIPAEARPALDRRLCDCHAFSFTHLEFAGACEGRRVLETTTEAA